MEKKTKSKFDDWSDVRDCNGCEHYWNNTCDAPANASKLGCNEFLATRGVIIPQQIEMLQSEIKWLKIGTTVSLLGVMVFAFLYWLGVLFL